MPNTSYYAGIMLDAFSYLLWYVAQMQVFKSTHAQELYCTKLQEVFNFLCLEVWSHSVITMAKPPPSPSSGILVCIITHSISKRIHSMIVSVYDYTLAHLIYTIKIMEIVPE